MGNIATIIKEIRNTHPPATGYMDYGIVIMVTHP